MEWQSPIGTIEGNLSPGTAGFGVGEPLWVSNIYVVVDRRETARFSEGSFANSQKQPRWSPHAHTVGTFCSAETVPSDCGCQPNTESEALGRGSSTQSRGR